MFGIGETELVMILVFGFLLFGPDKLPGVGRTIGRALRQFRDAEEGFTKVVQTEIVDPINQAATSDIATGERDDSDDDIDASPDGATSATSAPKETFAERKARMEAEHRATSDGVPAAEADLADADSDEDLPDAAAEPAAPARRSAASLYGLDSSADTAAPNDPPAPEDSGEGEGE